LSATLLLKILGNLNRVVVRLALGPQEKVTPVFNNINDILRGLREMNTCQGFGIYLNYYAKPSYSDVTSN